MYEILPNRITAYQQITQYNNSLKRIMLTLQTHRNFYKVTQHQTAPEEQRVLAMAHHRIKT